MGMVASPRNTYPKSLKKRGSYRETTKQIKLPTSKSILRLIKVTEEEIKAWKERALSEEYFAVFFGWDFIICSS
jgi:hypothetical protein